MIAKNWAVKIATLNLPAKTKMAGTIGSIWAFNGFNIVYFLSLFPSLGLGVTSYPFWVPILASVFAFFIIKQALNYFSEKDPALICLDEVVGMLVTMCLIEISLLNNVLGLIFFRIFDGLKLFGIKQVEQLPGAWGVLLDDVLAGIYANLAVHLTLLVSTKMMVFFNF